MLCLLSRSAGGDSWLESGQENTSLYKMSKVLAQADEMILLVTGPSSVSSGVATKKASVSVDQWTPRVLRLPAGSHRVRSDVSLNSQLLRYLLQHLSGIAPLLSEQHLPLCHETAEILEFLECLFWCVGSREAIVNVKRFLDHGCSFRILVLVVICHLVEHSCGQEWRRGNAKSQPLHPAIVESVGVWIFGQKSVHVPVSFVQSNFPEHFVNVSGDCNVMSPKL